jgi:hypothetical protein
MAKVFLNTNGKGFWTDQARKVQITKLILRDLSDEIDCGELAVYFSAQSWNIDDHGLIYTDPKFLKELRAYLQSIGLSKEVGYSEQGMQGDNYVSLDVEKKFIKSWAEKAGLTYPKNLSKLDDEELEGLYDGLLDFWIKI